jgi:small subunit ribosomal protein S13
MARIAGVDLPRRKAILYALPYIYGVGRATAKSICEKAKIPENRKVDELTEADVKAIRDILESGQKVEGDRKGLPVHGQRTHTNARTRKGPRRGLVSRKK